MHKITFLGTGGGRFVILTQRRYSGGIWLEFGKINMILDPGPGALIRALQFKKKPNKLDAIFVSHNHLDHYADAEVLIEAMTYGVKKKGGFLVTTPETLAYISDYHKEVIEILTPKPSELFQVLPELKIKALPTYLHANALGFKFFTEKGIVTYSSDTAYSEGLIKYYEGSKILILNTIFPYHKEIETHLNTKNALKIVKGVKPEIAVITHFGMQMLNANPDREAKIIEKETKVKTIAAKDGMILNLDEAEGNEEGEDEKQLKLNRF
jgi:ribonuclease BN (tRNA processing enzyme)